MVDVPWLPCAIVSEAGEAESQKFCGRTTVKVTVVVCLIPPPVPVTVMG